MSALTDTLDPLFTDELRDRRYQGRENPLAGHCYVYTEVLHHLIGGKPMFVRHEGEPHWFLMTPDGVLDPTASQFQTPVPYERARGKGLLTLRPSARARTVLSRLGVQA